MFEDFANMETLKHGEEIIPPQEDFTNAEIAQEGDKYNLMVVPDKNPDNKSAWITDKSGNRIGEIYYGNDGLEKVEKKFQQLEK